MKLVHSSDDEKYKLLAFFITIFMPACHLKTNFTFMATVLITGGTGMIGGALTTALLDKGYEVIIITRKLPGTGSDRLSYAEWNINRKIIDENAIRKADHIIHLAGAGVAEKRWTKKRKEEIVRSRAESGRLIAESLQKISNNVKTLVSSSGIGWYGPDVKLNPTPFKEDDPVFNDFLGTTCKQWEASLEPVLSMGMRLVKLRTGIVLSKKGGALKEFLKPLRFGLATILGNGKQIISWIHIDDLVSMYISAIENKAMSGTYNAVSPKPVSNKEFVLQLARTKRGKWFIPLRVPKFLLRLVLGEMSIEVLKSASVSADKISRTGFAFRFPELDSALKDALG